MTVEIEAANKLITTTAMLLTHAYVHWLADVHSAVFAPAFTLSFHDSECSRKPPNAHSLGRYVQQQKKIFKTMKSDGVFNTIYQKRTKQNI